MTIDEAIAEQEEFLEDNPHEQYFPWGKGMKLGIEALKRVQEDEYRGTEVPRELLPGETEE